MNDSEKFLLEAEKRFKKVAQITEDISVFPLSNKIKNISINKKKSKEFSEVFTPLWLVDHMIKQAKFSDFNVQTLDLCAGYGQFSIRLLRHLYNTYSDFNAIKFIRDNHAFSELQLSSCYKLLSIFGKKITLFIGDSLQLNKLPPAAKGIWCYIENYGYWVCLTKTILRTLELSNKKRSAAEKTFVSLVELIINNLNETNKKMKEAYQIKAHQLTPKMRFELHNQINDLVVDDKGKPVVKIIPTKLVGDMLDQVDDLEKKSILVLYNGEILEQLIHKKKIDPKQITFAVDFNGEFKSDIMGKMYGVETINFDPLSPFLHSRFNGRKFDVCLSNPPYNRGLDLKLLKSLMGNGTSAGSIAKEYIWVHPATWLLDQKDKSPLYINLKSMLDNKVKSVNLFNGNAVFGVELFSPCVISHIDINYNSSKIKVAFFKDIFNVENIADITKFGSAWSKIVKPFKDKMELEIKTRGHIWSYNTKTVVPNKSYCQLAAIIGHHSSDPKVMIKDDFYTMTIKNSSRNEGIREPRLDKPGGKTPTFAFDSDSDRNNFLSYLNTDFARFCLALYKIGQHLENGEMELIPWLDFTQSWDDEKLFKHFDINQETQDYIRKFLPDYYGIRK